MDHKSLNKKNVKVGVVALVFLVAILGGWYSWQHKNGITDEQVVESLGTHIVLPEEIPTVATVTDKEKLTKEPFFQNAENGDKVIVFKQARRAYLYRPSENIIIDMTVVAVEQGSPQAGSENIPVFQVNEQ